MTGKQLKMFAKDLPDDSIIEYKNYSWEEIESSKIRAVITPKLTLDDVCNLEASEAKG